MKMIRFRSAMPGAVLCITALCPGATAFANRDIVFSAQYYRWSGEYFKYRDPSIPPEETLADIGRHHLYRINADGSGRRRLTFGNQDDYVPVWSPDGKKVLFARNRVDKKHAVCTVNAGGGLVTSLIVFPGEYEPGELRYQWSPNGQWVAVALVRYDPDRTEYWLYLINCRTRQARKIANVLNFAWSPDSKRLYLSRETGGDRIMEAPTGRFTTVAHPVWNPVWLDSGTIGGNFRSHNDMRANHDEQVKFLRFIGIHGRERQRLSLKGADKSEKMELYPCSATWRRLSPRSHVFIVEAKSGMSDGPHHNCYLVNFRTGHWSFLQEGMLLGISPGGSRFAVANREWVGPYKRGGRRVGALKIVSIKTEKARAITSQLVSVAGGDWRK